MERIEEKRKNNQVLVIEYRFEKHYFSHSYPTPSDESSYGGRCHGEEICSCCPDAGHFLVRNERPGYNLGGTVSSHRAEFARERNG